MRCAYNGDVAAHQSQQTLTAACVQLQPHVLNRLFNFTLSRHPSRSQVRDRKYGRTFLALYAPAEEGLGDVEGAWAAYS